MNNIDINSCSIKDLRQCVSSLIVENAKLKQENASLVDKIADMECMLVCKRHQYQEVLRNGRHV